MLESLLRVPLRILLTGLHHLLKLRWRWARPQVRGAHALAFTPAGKLVLVRLRYARGWRLPGGGVEANEEPGTAVLRELREEIGMTGHLSIRPAFEDEDVIDHKQDRSNIFVVTGVSYRPRWSWEVEAVAEFRPDALPADMSPRAARWLRQLLPELGERG